MFRKKKTKNMRVEKKSLKPKQPKKIRKKTKST